MQRQAQERMKWSRERDVATSLFTSTLRAGAGMIAAPSARPPSRTLELFDMEGCPYCRAAREALSTLDLDAMVYPCPKGGERFRPEVVRRGGKARFPYLHDPNTDLSLYESAEIVRYLAHEYGGAVPTWTRLGRLGIATSMLASGARPSRGLRARPSRRPERPLELWSFEASPYCRLVREVLCELELPYLLHNVARGSRGRAAFVARSGKMMVPYLADPNTGRELFESAEIVRYLEESYGA